MPINLFRLSRELDDFAAGTPTVPNHARLLSLNFNARVTSKNTFSLGTAWGLYVLERHTSAIDAWANVPWMPIMLRTPLPHPLEPMTRLRFIASTRTREVFCADRHAKRMVTNNCEETWRDEWDLFWREALPTFDYLLLGSSGRGRGDRARGVRVVRTGTAAHPRAHARRRRSRAKAVMDPLAEARRPGEEGAMNGERRRNSCGGSLVRGLEAVRDPQSLEAFEVQSCASCGLGHTSPIPDNLGAYYGEAYYGKRPGFTDRYCLARRLRILASATPATRATRALLDLAAASAISSAPRSRRAGRHRHRHRRGGGERTEADSPVRPGSTRCGPKRCPPRRARSTPSRCGTPSSTSPIRRARSKARARCSRRTARSSSLSPTPPGSRPPSSRAAGSTSTCRATYHFSRSALEALLGRAGFTVTRWHHQELELDVFGWMQSALNAVLPQAERALPVADGQAGPRRQGRARAELRARHGARACSARRDRARHGHAPRRHPRRDRPPDLSERATRAENQRPLAFLPLTRTGGKNEPPVPNIFFFHGGRLSAAWTVRPA